MTGGYAEQVVEGFSFTFSGERIRSERSRFQQIDVYENHAFGRMLVLDGLTQTTERDEFIYHEMLVHVPMLSHPAPERVLVIGGGDGGTLRRVLEHPTVTRAVMVEIDDRVTAVCRELMPSIGGDAWDDPRADVRFDDGIAFIRDTDETFDVIIIDSSDPVGPGEALFTEEFYASAARRLRPGGLLAAQSGSPMVQQDELNRAFSHASAAFGERVRIFLGYIPTYPGQLWSFLLAGLDGDPDAAVAGARAAERGIVARWWTPDFHAASFQLPRLVADVVDSDEPPHHWGYSPEEASRRAVPRG